MSGWSTNYKVDEAKVHRIQQMRRSGYTLPEIASAEKVSTSTVRRYTDPGYRIRAAEHSYVHRERKAGRLSFIERSERYHDNRRPLYDPKLEALEPLSTTAEFCGDPRPGRRELVAAVPDPERQARRQPWRPGTRTG